MENSDKDSFNALLEFSQITPENWLAPDRKDYPPFGITKDQWIARFLDPQLEAKVPKDVVRLFEIARSAMIYSWFFYPLATLGLDQCTRIAELAASERCRLLGQEALNFGESIKTLMTAGIINTTDKPRWDDFRRLRNNRSHLDGFMLTDPDQAANTLRNAAELINQLFR